MFHQNVYKVITEIVLSQHECVNPLETIDQDIDAAVSDVVPNKPYGPYAFRFFDLL